MSNTDDVQARNKAAFEAVLADRPQRKRRKRR